MPLLLRYRQRVLCLNYAQELTFGNLLGFSAMLSRLDPNIDVSTGIAKSQDGKIPMAGQVDYSQGQRSAHLTYLLPDEISDLPEESMLIDYLAVKAGEMGALNLLADVQESHPAFEMLRKDAFKVYCWENVWKLPSRPPSTTEFKDLWQEERDTDEQSVRTLYQTVVPPIVQAAEPFINASMRRLVYRQEGELMAFTENISGPRGFFLKPVIHPSVEDVHSLIGDLIVYLQSLGKPVYFPVRSYQAWIADALEDLGAKSAPKRALMVKHLAVGVPSENGLVLRKRIEAHSPEPTSSIVHQARNISPDSDCI